MTFAEWRKREGLSLRAAAQRISEKGGASISHTQLDNLERGRGSILMATADLIKRGTGGAVTRLDWPESTPTQEMGNERARRV